MSQSHEPASRAFLTPGAARLFIDHHLRFAPAGRRPVATGEAQVAPATERNPWERYDSVSISPRRGEGYLHTNSAHSNTYRSSNSMQFARSNRSNSVLKSSFL